MEFMNGRVLAKVTEPGKKVFPALNLPGEIGEEHDNFRMHQWREVLDPALEPRLIDLTHRCHGILAFRFVHDLLLIILVRASAGVYS